MKRKWAVLPLLFVAMMLTTSCGKKKETQNIITHKPIIVRKKATQKVGDYVQTRDINWLGNAYKVEMKRMADASLPLADDGVGNKYYDNKISIRILRKDGSEFFKRTFTKADFLSYVDKIYKDDSALLGIVFDKAEGNELIFAGSVGSPDKLSDEYVPLVVKISNLGAVHISKDTRMDTGSDATGPKGSVDEAEEDGV